jgi:multidrug resistance protein, MATE family
MRQPADVVELAIPYFNVIILSMLPLSLFFSCKQYCEGLSNTKLALVISVAGNALNILLNYLLIYGKWGLPELGYIGAAWASFYARLFMGLSFLVLVFRSPLTREITAVFTRARISLLELRALWKIGINSALQFTFEVAAFAIAGFMAGSFGKEHIDAHGIALTIAAFTYMFGSGIGSAATIGAGIYHAQENWKEIKLSAYAAIRLVLFTMGTFGLLFLLLHKVLPFIFTDEPDITRLAGSLLIIAAMFQVFDGLQVTVIGILRGLKDVKIPTLITLVGYWLIALPLAYLFAFKAGLKTIGVWFGLLSALVFVAVLLLWRLRYLLARNLQDTPTGQK